MGGLKNRLDIKKPTEPYDLINNHRGLEMQIIDYYRCLDMEKQVDPNGLVDEDDENQPEKDSEEDSDDDSDDDEAPNLYSKEKQDELAQTQPMLIKAYGLLASGHSITLNLKGFKPFFYIKIPDNWQRTQVDMLVKNLQGIVYYKFKKHLVKTKVVIRKPFTEFTGNDQFKFLKLYFKNKQAYDKYAQKLANPILINGLNQSKAYKYDLYESNIEPIIKFLHLTGLNPAGWGKISARQYEITKKRTSTTDFEVDLQWDEIKPLDFFLNAPINVAAFDIEADSSHGDFPIGKKNYQKLAQDWITIFNDLGINHARKKRHWLFDKNPKATIEAGLQLVFNDNYNNNNIHYIKTINNLIPHKGTVTQLAYAVYQLFQDYLENELSENDLNTQVWDLLEYNLPLFDTNAEHSSNYGQLAIEIIAQMVMLYKKNNVRFKDYPVEVITTMIDLAFNPLFDGFNLNCIYTKHNLKPSPAIIESIVPDIYKILNDCAQFVTHKKMPEPSTFKTADESVYDKDNMCQDAFVKQLTDLLDQYLPAVEGDPTIQIGTTFQILGQPDCYLKHIITLGSCDEITNEEMIRNENQGIYLPAEDLAKDLINYEQQLSNTKLDSKELNQLIQIRVGEIKSWDKDYRKRQCKKVAEYRQIKQSATDKSIVIVECFETEKEVLLAWKDLIITNDPSILLTYNGFGFDMNFLYERACELGCSEEFCQLGRLKKLHEPLFEQKLVSAGLGDNCLKYIPMNGRVQIDLYKVVQKDHKLDSYKLDSVCNKFLYKEKMDLPPQEIFIKQKGSSADRKMIAVYCLVDCILCNRLVCKLEIIGNNMAMSKVCKVPLAYLFLRGQGVKIFSLVAEFCSRKGFLIPVLPKADLTSDEGYEGAIVLKPYTGIYFDPIAVADFNSLYPSSMISENLSHDSLVEIGGKYDNLPGFEYVDIEYDTYKWTTKPGTKKRIKVKTGVQTCRYAQLPNDEKSILPSILMDLLSARKAAKKKMEIEKDPFRAKIFDGEQLALKITANSLYGQTGAKTSQIFKKEIASSTTAVGRQMIMFSKKYAETNYKDKVVTLDLSITGVFDKVTKELKPTKYTGMVVRVKNVFSVYGDTDSLMWNIPAYDMEGNRIKGIDAVFIAMAICKKMAAEISAQLKRPQNLDFEKVMWPWILFAKKRYHGDYYTKMDDLYHYANSMGISLKRRDNAPIVKFIFGGALDIVMKEHDINKAFGFVIEQCTKLLKGGFPMDMFVISKALRGYYRKPNSIAHNVLAQRQAQRDPGNKFQSNDRVPFCFFAHPHPVKGMLMGEKIETVNYIKENKLPINYALYLSNQVLKPVAQLFDLVPGFEKTSEMLTNLAEEFNNDRNGMKKLDSFFLKKSTMPKLNTMMELANQARAKQAVLDQQIIIDDEPEPAVTIEDEVDPFDETAIYDESNPNDDDGTYDNNYDNPDF